MTIRIRKSAGAVAFLAATSLAIPTQAASLDVPGSGAVGHWSAVDDTANGWGGGWGGYGGRWRGHGRVDGGDVLAGILIFGGAIAVARAIENSNDRNYRERDVRYRDRDVRYRDNREYDRDARYRDYRNPRDDEASRRGIDGAIEDCVDEVERDQRVASVDTAERDAAGWRVEGDLARGGRFACSLSSDGRVRDVDIDIGRRSSREDAGYEQAARQPDIERTDGRNDDYYASARSRADAPSPTRQVEVEVEKEQGSGERTWERGQSDDRYETAGGPDYALAQ
ncbi:hypothetical protein EKN06_01240 [Croceicoccus ponticola]|uniref:PepSY domain-containing protein n=1 Tax=Croceicoccus ponticola TaxID=2217664 RepID=A0A437H006_9SPHN|nr:hypothetical protein [Croceicoccus ponticola]RVQ68883.1 hypothetical protein EKN06_01240 [Croceicoccus ponticola]